MANHDEHAERLLRSLVRLEAAAADNIDRSRQLRQRARTLREELRAGSDLVPLVEAESSPRMVELISSNMVALETAGAEFRASEALALRAQGLTIEAIANLFGVTRQRISALLKQKAALAPVIDVLEPE